MKFKRLPYLDGKQVRGTIFRLLARPFHIEIRISSRSQPRIRRQIALLLFQHLKPAFSALEDAELIHDDGHLIDFFSHQCRDVVLTQACQAETPRGRLGFEIRIRRLESGLSQEELAARCGIAISTLSRIEKGHRLPRIQTLRRLEAALGKIPEFEIRKREDPRRLVKLWKPGPYGPRLRGSWATESD